MNEHEITRIAAAMNQLRPDWPLKQLGTLLRDDRMVTRPRRDVTVALSWVACEAGTSSPYRVLENGPWWKAAGIEGAATNREPFDQTTFCHICGKPERRCQSTRIADDDHTFESVLSVRQRREAGDYDKTVRVVDHLRGQVVESKAEPEPVERPKREPNPHVEAARAELAAMTVHPVRDYPTEEPTT